MRIAGYGNVEIYQPDPLLYWKLKPNQDCYTKIDRKPVHINSLGTRGAEFQATKPVKFQPDIVILADANLWTQFSDRNSPEFVKSFMRRVQLKNLLRRFATYHYVVEYRLKDVYERTRARFIPMDPRRTRSSKSSSRMTRTRFFANRSRLSAAWR